MYESRSFKQNDNNVAPVRRNGKALEKKSTPSEYQPIQMVEAPDEARAVRGQAGSFIGDPATYHIHFAGQRAHYKYGNNRGTRIDIDGGAASDYNVGRLQRAIEECEANVGRYRANASSAEVLAFLRARFAELQPEEEDEEEDEVQAAPAPAAAAAVAVVPAVDVQAAVPDEDAQPPAAAGGNQPQTAQEYEDDFM